MDNLIFDQIKIEGFGSIIKPLTFNFNSPGINCIVGENGVGKTTIINALSWVLYKQLLKPASTIKPWDFLLGSNFKGTKVEIALIKFNEELRVIRCLDYKGKIEKKVGKSGLFVYHNGELIKPKYKKNIQYEIEKFIGYSFNLFKNAILFGQEMERLMKDTGPNKKKLFEEVFDTNFIESAKTDVAQRAENRFKIITNLQNSYENVRDKIKSLESQRREILVERDERLEKVKRDIIQIEETKSKAKFDPHKYRNVKCRIKKYTSNLKEDLENEEFKLNMWVNSKKSEMESLEMKIKGLQEEYKNLPKNCDKCGSKIPISKRKKITRRIKIKIGVEKKSLKALDIEYHDLKLQYRGIKKDLLEQEKIKSIIENLKSRLSELEKLKVEDKLSKLKQSMINKIRADWHIEANRYESKTSKLSVEIDKLAEEERKLESKLKTYNKRRVVDEWLLNDALSNSGLKSYIFDAMIPVVNKAAQKYSNEVGFNLEVYIDLESSRKDMGILITKGNNTVLYGELSKGQKQLADLVLAFALNDVVTMSKPINCLILDELFESLSKNNVEVVNNMIMKKSTTTNIFIITHQYAFTPMGAKNTFLYLDENQNTVLQS